MTKSDEEDVIPLRRAMAGSFQFRRSWAISGLPPQASQVVRNGRFVNRSRSGHF
jgi:hypothetical protein